jgi:signal transduction histidine kinase
MKKRFSSLRYRLIFFVLLSALPALGITLYTGLEQRQQAADGVQREVSQLARVAAVNQQMFVENTRMFMTALAHLPALQLEDASFCDEMFTHLVSEHYPYYATLYVADTQAKVLCSASGTHIPDDLDECQHYKKALTATDFVISNYHICDSTGKAILSLAYPILDDSGKPKMVLNVSLDLAWINELASEAQLPTGAILNVYNQKGTILAFFPPEHTWMSKTLPKGSFLHNLLQLRQATAVGPGLDGTVRLYAITTMQGASDDVYVSLGIPVQIAFAEANRTLWRNLLILTSITILALAAAWLLGDMLILRPTRSLVSATEKLAAGELQTRTNIPYEEGELGQLASAFNQMAESLSQRETERDQAEMAMREYAKDLERSNRDLQDFANITSHDLQEPLRKIQTFSELLKLRYQAGLDERGQDYLQRIHESAERMQALVLDLLAYSRVTSRGKPFQTVDLNLIAQTVLNDLELQIEETHAQVEVEELPSLEADGTQIRQLLQNLLSNALKFHNDHQQPIIKICGREYSEVNPRSSQKRRAKYCEIQVKDNGIGFNEKYLDRIFQPFQRLHGRGEFQGTGMGLAICRKIVERHNGTIAAYSAPGQGATFIVRLPMQQNNEVK